MHTDHNNQQFLFYIYLLTAIKKPPNSVLVQSKTRWTRYRRITSFISKVEKTRAPRGTDRSPEYNEHFCYKLDSRVKNLTTEWNQKQQHFITHASRSLLWIRFVAVAFRSEEEVFWRRGPPWPILPRPGSAPGQIWPKHLYACAGLWTLHPYQVS